MRQRFWFNPTLADRNFFLAALAGMLLTNLCLSGTALALVAERESGTYEQVLALPTRRWRSSSASSCPTSASATP